MPGSMPPEETVCPHRITHGILLKVVPHLTGLLELITFPDAEKYAQPGQQSDHNRRYPNHPYLARVRIAAGQSFYLYQLVILQNGI